MVQACSRLDPYKPHPVESVCGLSAVIHPVQGCGFSKYLLWGLCGSKVTRNSAITVPYPVAEKKGGQGGGGA